MHTSTGVAPFDLVLSRTPPRLGVEDFRIEEQRKPSDTRLRWLNKLTEVMQRARETLHKSQARMKRNFDAGLRSRGKRVSLGDYFVLHHEKKNAPEGLRHKLAPKCEGPFRVCKVKDRTVVIDRGTSTEEVNLSRVEKVRPPQGTSTSTGSTTFEGPSPGGSEYVIDRLTRHRLYTDGTADYKVRWLGFQEETFQRVADLPR